MTPNPLYPNPFLLNTPDPVLPQTDSQVQVHPPENPRSVNHSPSKTTNQTSLFSRLATHAQSTIENTATSIKSFVESFNSSSLPIQTVSFIYMYATCWVYVCVFQLSDLMIQSSLHADDPTLTSEGCETSYENIISSTIAFRAIAMLQACVNILSLSVLNLFFDPVETMNRTVFDHIQKNALQSYVLFAAINWLFSLIFNIITLSVVLPNKVGDNLDNADPTSCFFPYINYFKDYPECLECENYANDLTAYNWLTFASSTTLMLLIVLQLFFRKEATSTQLNK